MSQQNDSKITGVSDAFIKEATDAASLVNTLVNMGYEAEAAKNLVKLKGFEGAKKLILDAIKDQAKKLEAEAAKAKADGTEEAWYKRVMNPTTTGGKVAKWTALALAAAGVGYGGYKLYQRLSSNDEQEHLPAPHDGGGMNGML